MTELLEPLLRQKLEALTYLVFFGLIFGLGLLEFIVGLRGKGADRRRRWPTNWGLTVINIMALSLLPLSALAAADLARTNGWGLFNLLDAPFVLVLLAGFLVRSLMSWIVHYAMHNVPLLWRVHRVHHSDTHMDVSTTVHFHLLEMLLAAPAVIATVMLIGIPPVVIMLFEIFDAAIAIFSHANIRLPVGWSVASAPWSSHRICIASTIPRSCARRIAITVQRWCVGTRCSAHCGARTPRTCPVNIGLKEVQDRRASSLLYLLSLPFRTARIKSLAECGTAGPQRGQRESADAVGSESAP